MTRHYLQSNQVPCIIETDGRLEQNVFKFTANASRFPRLVCNARCMHSCYTIQRTFDMWNLQSCTMRQVGIAEKIEIFEDQ